MSSLYGNPPTTTGSGSSFFGNATTPSGLSLPAASLTTSTPLPSLFNSTSATSSPSLFGSLDTPLSPAPSDLGSNTTTSGGRFSITQPLPASTSFFGGTQPAQTSQFNQATNTWGQSTSRESAHFNSLLERQKKNKARFTLGDQNGRLGQLPSLNMDLGDLARRAQAIGTSGNKPSSINASDSRAHYLLAGSGVSPGKAYKDFQALEKDASAGLADHQPVEPFDPDNSKYIRGLQQRGREAMVRESMDRVNREFDVFLEESLSINFEEQKQRIMEHFGLVPREGNEDGNALDKSSAGPGRGSFGKSSRKTKNAFAESAKGSTRSVFGRSGMERSMIGAPGMATSTAKFFGDETNDNGMGSTTSRVQYDQSVSVKERLFIAKIEQLNQARMEGRAYCIFQEFGQVEGARESDSPRQLADAYRALREITGESGDATSSPQPDRPRERQYASAYLDDNMTAFKTNSLKRRILDGSRRYLEQSFYRELESLVQKNPREAQLGGRPSITNKIRAYIRVRSARKDLAPDGAKLDQLGENGDYCWILIFYLLRCGFVKEALEYVNNDPDFQAVDRRFLSYLTTYAGSRERRLSRKLQEMINGEYQQRLRVAPENTVDPYRMACYNIVGRCDLGRRNLEVIGQGVEDWIWLQFSLAREYDRIEGLSGEIFGLDQIVETVTEIGQKHFQKGQAESSSGYGTFFFMQILAGMFEPAVAYLHFHNPTSAVHVAIALAYYGLLRVSDCQVAGNELCEWHDGRAARRGSLTWSTVTYSTSEHPLINFVPLLAYHTAPFRTALPLAAVDYLTLICLNSDLTPPSLGSSQTNACHECLRQLSLETRDFAKLLGDIRIDGTRIAGAIEQKAKLINLDSHEDFLKAVTLQAAAIADEQGQVADAALLYHLCEDYDNVVSIINRALADAVTLDLGESPTRLQPLKPRHERHHDWTAQSALSLTQSTDSPQQLAQNLIGLYNSNASYYSRITQQNRNTCGALLQLLNVRAHLESDPPAYMAVLEGLNALGHLPLNAGGSIPVVRAAAAAFGALPPILARCAGVSVVWAVGAIGRQREALHKGHGWDGGSGDDREAKKEQLSSMTKDLMVFAGLVKYKLPGRVYDMLTRVGGEVGAY